MTLARKKKPGSKEKERREADMNEMEGNKIMEANEEVKVARAVYSEGFSDDIGNEAGSFIRARDLLDSVLRPRLVSKGKDPNWEETYIRLVAVYDILLSNVSLSLGEEALEGTVRAVMDPDNYFIDLTRVFDELFPQAKDDNTFSIPRRSLRPNVLLVMDDNLTRFLSPDNLKETFGRLVEGTRVGFVSPFAPAKERKTRAPKADRGNSTNFLRFREAISLAARSIGENLSEEQARTILQEVLESYLSYAQNIRSLPKPDVELEG
jgi:hypothetical protein